MPSKKLTKEENQPLIKTLLPNRTDKTECINVDRESANIATDEDNSKPLSSADRSCTEADLAPPSTSASLLQGDPDLTAFKEVKSAKKKEKEKSFKWKTPE